MNATRFSRHTVSLAGMRTSHQAALVAVSLTVLATLAYGSHAIHGGFISDGWSVRATYVFAPGDGLVGKLDQFLAQPGIDVRPLFAIYLVLLNAAFGDHTTLWLAWLSATSVFMSWSLYLLLRKLDVKFHDAALIACMVLIFPAASSLRLWTATASISVAIGVAALGFVVALNAFNAKDRRRPILHSVSLLAFVASLLLYEAAISLMLASVLLYRLAVPWRVAVQRWALDVAVLVSLTSLLAISSPTAKETQDFAGMWAHGGEIFGQVGTMLGTVVVPLGTAHWYVVGLLVVVPLAAMRTTRRLAPGDPAGVELRFWLWALLAGIVVVVLGYAVFVPGIDYYVPMGPGIANRVNAVPSIGWVISLYSYIVLAAVLAFRGATALRLWAPVLTLLGCFIISVGWFSLISRDVDAFTAAFREDKRILAVMRAAIPKPPPNSMIWTFGQPVEIAPGVPVFGNTWDMTTSVQLMYGDPTIRSLVGFPGTTFECWSNAVVPGNNLSYAPGIPSPENPFASPYGRTYFIDTTTGRVVSIRNRDECRAAAASFSHSPPFPGERSTPGLVLPPLVSYRLMDDAIVAGAENRRIPIRRKAVTGYVDYVTDNVSAHGSVISLSGWAAVERPPRPAAEIVGFVGGAGIAHSKPATLRPDVVLASGESALGRSGFTMFIERSLLECGVRAAGLKIFGVADGMATRLSFVGDSEQQLDAAC
jgi:hypothetical protein